MSDGYRFDCTYTLLHAKHPTMSADISWLLDPAYASSSPTSASPQQTKAYIDHDGLVHDPDYRHFPVRQTKTQSYDDEDEQDCLENYITWRPLSPSYSPYPSSYDSDQSSLSSEHEHKLRKKPRILDLPLSLDDFVEEVAEDKHIHTVNKQHRSPTETVKREWQALSLSWHIGVFRMKRRVRGAFSR